MVYLSNHCIYFSTKIFDWMPKPYVINNLEPGFPDRMPSDLQEYITILPEEEVNFMTLLHNEKLIKKKL